MSLEGPVHHSDACTARGFPPDLSFLIPARIDPTLLMEAERAAAAADVTPGEALLRGGLLDEETVYRAFARHAGLPFSLNLAVHGAARYPEGVLTGVLPLDSRAGEPNFAYAPPPDRFGEVAARNLGDMGLVVTTPTALRDALIARRGALVAGRAADGLPSLDPDLSARSGVTIRQATALSTVSAMAPVSVLLWPTAAIQALSLAAFVLFMATAAIRIAALLHAAPVRRRPRRRMPDRDLPIYTVLMPVHREARVLARLLGAIDRLDYPKAKLDAKLLVEAGDAETLAELDRIGRPCWLEVIAVPPGTPQTKPRALNAALPIARGAFLTIYDAEDVPDPAQLRLAVETFRRMPPDVACLQARLTIDNTGDGWLTRLFTLEYAALFDVINPALAKFDLPVPLGGTSNHIRTTTLRALGGWDAWNVTEDADLGLRLALAGYRVEDLASTTIEEAPRTVQAWIHQRRRWMKGYLQVAITHSRHPIRSWLTLGPMRFGAALALTAGIVGSALAYPAFLVLLVSDIRTGDILRAESVLEGVTRSAAIVLFGAGLVAMTLPALEGARRRRLRGLARTVPLLPLYYLLVSWATWRALIDLVVDPFRWLKTEHGLARTSRSGLLFRQPDARRPQ